MTELEPRLVVRILLLAASAVVVHLLLTARLPVARVIPEPALLVAVVAGYEAGPRAGALAGFVAGLTMDLLLVGPVGAGALVAVVVGHLVGRVRVTAMRPPQIPLTAVLVSTFCGSAVLGFIHALPGYGGTRSPLEILRIAAVVALWHLFLYPVAAPVTRVVLDVGGR